ncbi:MAG: sulfite exporter TauE/SafE family protein [Magnetospirillum sp.]|nr:sulfite exporter TauE/SafE family protein [Magnetospirillum sp.]
MSIYLPIAERSVDMWGLLAVGGGVGLLSGIFGVGGGFLLTPLLMFMGIPPAVAVSTGANQVLGSSVSGVLAHWRRGNVDVRMGVLLLSGGFVGSAVGVYLFALLKKLGQIDLVISLTYVGFLGGVGALMLIESVHALMGAKAGKTVRKKRMSWHGWPLRMRFPRSRLYVSAIPPVAVGVFGGVLAAIMGVGGGFVMVPLMIYVLGMPTAVVVGTSLFQIIFVTANVTFMQSLSTQTVDVVLALILLVGGAVGAQIGARIGMKLRGEQLRILLALLVLVVCGKMAWDLVARPSELFSVMR